MIKIIITTLFIASTYAYPYEEEREIGPPAEGPVPEVPEIEPLTVPEIKPLAVPENEPVTVPEIKPPTVPEIQHLTAELPNEVPNFDAGAAPANVKPGPEGSDLKTDATFWPFYRSYNSYSHYSYPYYRYYTPRVYYDYYYW